MFGEVERVKERRRERLEKIRIQSRDSFAPFVDDWKDPYDEEPGSPFPSGGDKRSRLSNTLPPQEKLGIQTFVSLLIIGLAYLMFQSGVSVPLAWKESAREVMTRDFNFSGVANWYEARFGSLPSVLPVLSPKKSAVPASAITGSQTWKLPKTWKVAESFDPIKGRMVFDTGGDGKVWNSGETGWVTFVGEKPGYGLMVSVRFPKGREIWYGNLENAAVEQNDVVYNGYSIGVAKQSGPASHQVILSVKEKENLVNPLEVIAID